MSVKTVSSQADAANPLGYEKEGKLLVGFAIPCIISMLVTSLYNIVDQIFIGQGVGLLGNAATNIAFPLSIACTAIALLLGIGSATNFSLQLGAGNEKRSAEYAGNCLCLMALFWILSLAVRWRSFSIQEKRLKDRIEIDEKYYRNMLLWRQIYRFCILGCLGTMIVFAAIKIL